MAPNPTSILFVCLGNICRSPLAEGIFAHLAESRGIGGEFRVDSAGTGAYHTGERPDSRSIAVASNHGVNLYGVARQVTHGDFSDFDVIVAMDRSNRRSLERMRGRGTHNDRTEIVMMRDYDPERGNPDVPDPYYGGPDGFERVYRMLERCCDRLLDTLTDRQCREPR